LAFFRIILHGEAICIPHDHRSASMLGISASESEGADPIIGFYTTRLLRAETESDAATAAKTLVAEEWSKPPLRDINVGSSPRLSVDAVERIGRLIYLASGSGKGFTFYTSSDSSKTRH